MVMKLPKFLDDHYPTILFCSIIFLLSLWGYVEYAEGLCLATCQAQLKERGGSSEVTGATEPIFISIRTSETCQLSGTCPTYKELADTYDNSNRYLSGDFFFDNETQTWKRDKPAIYKSFSVYKTLRENIFWMVFVNPDDYTWDRTKTIFIESEYMRPDKGHKIEANTLYQFEGREIDGCDYAIIGWKNNGTELLLDTLNYFYSDCKVPLEIDHRKEVFFNSTIFPDCDKECFELRERFKLEEKAYYLALNELREEKEDDDEEESGDWECYGVHCDREEKEEITNSTSERLQKYEEKIKELEDIKKCEEYKIEDDYKEKGKFRSDSVDCEDEDEREDYIEEIEKEKSGEEEEEEEESGDWDCYGIHCD